MTRTDILMIVAGVLTVYLTIEAIIKRRRQNRKLRRLAELDTPAVYLIGSGPGAKTVVVYPPKQPEEETNEPR